MEPWRGPGRVSGPDSLFSHSRDWRQLRSAGQTIWVSFSYFFFLEEEMQSQTPTSLGMQILCADPCPFEKSKPADQFHDQTSKREGREQGKMPTKQLGLAAGIFDMLRHLSPRVPA